MYSPQRQQQQRGGGYGEEVDPAAAAYYSQQAQAHMPGQYYQEAAPPVYVYGGAEQPYPPPTTAPVAGACERVEWSGGVGVGLRSTGWMAWGCSMTTKKVDRPINQSIDWVEFADANR